MFPYNASSIICRRYQFFSFFLVFRSRFIDRHRRPHRMLTRAVHTVFSPSAPRSAPHTYFAIVTCLSFNQHNSPGLTERSSHHLTLREPHAKSKSRKANPMSVWHCLWRAGFR